MREQLVHDYPEGPNVDTFRVLLVQSHFRRHVNECAHMLVIGRLRLVSEPKVNDLDLGIISVNSRLVHEDVGSLQVPVNDALVVNVRDCINDLFHDPGSHYIGELLAFLCLLLNEVEQLRILNVFHSHVEFAFELNQVFDFHNVLMIQLTE